jgi:DNA polymerase III delta prime subunit
MTINDFNNLWCEKYRPRKLEEFVTTDKNLEQVQSFAKNKQIPNLLFLGSPGIGKTTLAKIIVNSLLECQYLYINASDENGIDTIRTKVTGFAQTKSIDGNLKTIILDECDGLTMDGQRALRNTMEELAGFTRFILTANYKYKIIPALQSRCQSLDLTPPIDSVVKRCAHILKAENIAVENGQKGKLVELVKKFYPDIRLCINELQKFSVSGKLKINEFNPNDLLNLIYKEIKSKNINSLRKALIENESSFNSDYISLMRSLFNYIDETELDLDYKKKALIIVAEHLYRSAFVIDQEINFFACIILLSDTQLLGKYCAV